MENEQTPTHLSSPWTPEQLQWLRRFGIGLGLLAVGIFLWQIRPILPLFFFGFFLAYLLEPLVSRLEGRGLSRTAATALVFIALAMGGLAILLLVVPPLIQQVTALIEDCLPPEGRYYLMAQHGLEVLERRVLRGDLPPLVRQSLQQVSEQLGKVLLASLRGLVASLSGVVSLVLVPLIAFYTLQTYHPLKERLRWWVPPEYRRIGVALLQDISALVGRYVRGYLLLCLVVGVTDIAFLMACQQVFGMKFALAIGAVGGALYAVPYFGAIATTVTGALAGYTTAQHHPVACSLIVAVGLIVINQFFDWVVMPRVVGQRVGLHPLTVLFAVMAGGTIMGLAGMLLAVPTAGAMKLILRALFPRHFLPVPEGQGAAKMTAAQPTEGTEGGDRP